METNYNEEENLVKEYDSRLMKRLLRFVKPFKLPMVFVMILMLFSTLFDLSRPYLIKTAIDNYIEGFKSQYTILQKNTEGSTKINNIFIKKGNIKGGIPCSIAYNGSNYYIAYGTINQNKPFSIENGRLLQDSLNLKAYKLNSQEIKSLRKDDVNGIIRIALIILLLVFLIFILNYAQIYLLQLIGQKIVFSIREQLFKHVEGLSLSFFDKNPVGRLVTRLTNDVETLNDMYTGVLVYVFKDIFLLSGILIAMFILNIKLGIIVLISLPVIVLSAIIFKKYDRDAYRSVRVKLARINASLSENISGMKTVQIYHKEKKKFCEFDSINKDYCTASMRQVTVFAVFRPFIEFISSFVLAALVWFGGMSVLDGTIQFGVLFAFVNYLMQFFQPIFDLTEKYDILQSSMASSERIFMLMDNNEIINNKDNAAKVGRFRGEIEFKNVWFAYNEGEWILKDVSFKIAPGEKVAFVGATGAGKTSVISLIQRLYDIQKGQILMDGVDIKDIDKYELRNNMAAVLQDVFLFTGDIKGNIRLNNDGITDEQIVEVCKYVNADRFIEKLPDKYASHVSERGSTFSQGERQLIAFARAVAFNPPILILDEATSNIDTETESLIQDALSKITKDRTTIVVAHRLSTIRNSDKIIVLNKGRIKEMGSHDELLEKKGLYYNLYKLQGMEAL